MSAKVEVFVQLCINGRPIWLKSRATKSENTVRMTDKEYDRIAAAAEKELSAQVAQFEKAEMVGKK